MCAVVSEMPRGPNPMPVPCTLIDFSKPQAVSAALAGCDAVLDASHGFDQRMSDLGFHAAKALGLPHLAYCRPGWSEAEAPGAISVTGVSAAMALIEPGARVFSAAGWASLPACADFRGQRLFLRQTTPHDRPPPFNFVQLRFGTPPFTTGSESRLFIDLNIDTLLCRNLGGVASLPKVDAAVALGLRVILIAPAPPPEGAQVVQDVDEATAWVADL